MATFLIALLAGIAGAAIGFIVAAGGASVLAPSLGISSFEGASGYFAILIGLLGGIVGLIAGIVLALRMRGVRSFGAIAGRFGIIVVAIAGLVAAGIGYMYFNRDLVTSNGPPPQLAFEIRLAAGATLPASPNDITIHLDSQKGHMPARISGEKLRRDGDRPVIVGSVEIYYRESRRLLVLRLPNQPDRIFNLKLGMSPQHGKELGPWQRVDFIAEADQNPRRPTVDDNDEVRYRAVWAGED